MSRAAGSAGRFGGASRVGTFGAGRFGGAKRVSTAMLCGECTFGVGRRQGRG